MEFSKVNIDNYKIAQPYLENEKICEFGITPTCLYAPIDTGAFALKNDFLIFTCIEDGERYFQLQEIYCKLKK